MRKSKLLENVCFPTASPERKLLNRSFENLSAGLQRLHSMSPDEHLEVKRFFGKVSLIHHFQTLRETVLAFGCKNIVRVV